MTLTSPPRFQQYAFHSLLIVIGIIVARKLNTGFWTSLIIILVFNVVGGVLAREFYPVIENKLDKDNN